jgi:hypothetical protein
MSVFPWGLTISIALGIATALLSPAPAVANDGCIDHPGAPECNDLETWPIIEPDPEPVIPVRLYLPLVSTDGRTWFDQVDLEAAQRSYGYDPAIVAEHTWCTLDASAQPPSNVRYDHCLQHWHAGQPTDGHLAVYYWRSGATVQSLLISSTNSDEAQP